MAQHPPPAGVTLEGFDFTLTGHLTLTHKLIPGADGADPALGVLVFDFHADPAAAPDGLPAQLTVDADAQQLTVTLVGDYSVHDVLAGHVADLRARFRDQQPVTG